MCTAGSTWVPSLKEAINPHELRTGAKADKRHREVNIHTGAPPVPATPVQPQSATAPNSVPLKRRNNGGFAQPGSTMLSGPAGVPSASLSLGTQTLLGGG